MNELSHEVWEMRQCQRKADNLHFYLHKYRAEKIIEEYKDHYSSLSDSCQRQFMLASSRYSIVLSDYLLQIGDHKEAIKVMDALSSSNTLNLNADTILWLNYLVHQASVRYIPIDLKRNRTNIEKGYDCLMQCYILSSRNKISLYKGVSMQLLSKYLQNEDIFKIVKEFDAASLRYINEDGVSENLLAGNLAQRALNIFLRQKDAYLTVEGWRNLARCYFDIGDAPSSLECLNNALANPALDSIPDLKASVCQQMSMSLAALDDKQGSDYYRNQYLDLQDSTRQDKQLQARVIALENKTTKIWLLVVGAAFFFLFLCVLTLILIRMRRHRQRKTSASDDDLEELKERLSMLEIQCSDALRSNVELRSQVSVINGMLPLVERLRNAIGRGDTDYAREVAHDIDLQNSQLTRWIKLQQGSIAPKIETVALHDVFGIISNKEKGISKKDVEKRITVEDTSVLVKADKTLTLFIINTLIENARNSITTKGLITVSCSANKEERYAEISVTDNGKGMSEEQIIHLFDIKPIKDDCPVMKDEVVTHHSHCFGLQNCRGIMSRYRKISSIFSVCDIIAKSKIGEGTTISFRLPLAVRILIMLFMMSVKVTAATSIERYADSLYYCNVDGRYAVAMQYSDSCTAIINSHREKVKTETKLSIYNETAVAALSLHQWYKYRYYNYLYTNLYKEYTQDRSLPQYIEKMTRSEMIANMTMLVIIFLTLALLPIFWFAYLGPVIHYQRTIYRKKQSLKECINLLERKSNRLHVMNNIVSNQLSTVKHETMYYPSRISQMMLHDEDHKDQLDTVTYYSQLYTLLSTKMIAEQMDNSQFSVHETLFQGHVVLCNDELLSFLKLLLKRHNRGMEPQCALTSENDKYLTFSFLVDNSDVTESDIPTLFTMSTIHTDYLVMRQIMREIGDASLHHGTGISVTSDKGKMKINVTLPKSFSRRGTINP